MGRLGHLRRLANQRYPDLSYVCSDWEAENAMTTAPDQELTERPLVLFDGPCNLCNWTVRWLLARDKHQRLDFASLQSKAAATALARVHHQSELPDSIALIAEGKVHVLSSAAIHIARAMGGPWSLLRLVWLIPRPVRDGLYRWVAANRMRWFGRNDSCAQPDPNQKHRFLDADEAENKS
jgi:predicted DCC family thiol-disulfide oxidoreductase YuxK